MEVKNFDAKTGEELSQVKLSPEQTRMIIRILKEARHGAKQKSHP
ncbi:hypothetical protein NB22_08905 [Limosilactobacillus fermentum NB-22]|uniref:Uncharacterized protein n=1 Tax=Limosilactobacillus fermentum NB-22 TaxID=1408443 RepID=A0A829LZ25_LIMFE|nr:hypothetical protein NB22_08905 [Limosilactobacillus fermentum NB-22]